MNKKNLIAMMAAGSFCLSALTACGDSSTEARVPKGQQCANGLTAECLVGEWSMLGFANKGTKVMLPEFNYADMPGKLTFQPDGSFNFVLPTNAPAALVNDSDCNPIKGSWSVEGTVLTLSSVAKHFDNLQMCLGTGTHITLEPEVNLEDDPGHVRLLFGEIILMGKATNEQSVRDYSTEVFSISAM